MVSARSILGEFFNVNVGFVNALCMHEASVIWGFIDDLHLPSNIIS
jgi:hypothetical protein